MSDQDFRERVLSALERLEQKSERLEEKFDKKLASMEEKFDKRFESIETRLGLLEQSVSWIRGKLEEGNPTRARRRAFLDQEHSREIRERSSNLWNTLILEKQGLK